MLATVPAVLDTVLTAAAGALAAGVLDAGVPEAAALDAGVLDAGVLEAGVLDTDVAEGAGVPLLFAVAWLAGAVWAVGCAPLVADPLEEPWVA